MKPTTTQQRDHENTPAAQDIDTTNKCKTKLSQTKHAQHKNNHCPENSLNTRCTDATLKTGTIFQIKSPNTQYTTATPQPAP